MPKQRKRSLPASAYPDDAFTVPEVQAVLETRRSIGDRSGPHEDDVCLAWPVACYHVVREYLETPHTANARDLGLLQQQDLAFVSALLASVKTWLDQPRSEWTVSRWIAGLDQLDDLTVEDVVRGERTWSPDLAFVDYKTLAGLVEDERERAGLQRNKQDTSVALRVTLHNERERRLAVLDSWKLHFAAWKRLGERRDLDLPVRF